MTFGTKPTAEGSPRDATRAMSALSLSETTTTKTESTTPMRMHNGFGGNDAVASPGSATGGGAKRTTRLVFRTRYYTNWGENLVVCGSTSSFGKWNPSGGIRMSCAHVGENELEWRGEVIVADEGTIEYRYAVVDEHNHVIAWDGEVRKLELATMMAMTTAERGVECVDAWCSKATAEHVFGRDGFARVVAPGYAKNGSLIEREHVGDRVPAAQGDKKLTVKLEVTAPGIASAVQYVAVSGSCSALGSDDRAKAVALTKKAGSEVWSIEFEVPAAEMPFKYTYLLRGDGDDVEEARHPRECSYSISCDVYVSSSAETRILYRDGVFKHRASWKGSGMALPVFSLRTGKSVGCGDFVDLRQAVDIAHATGMSVLQVLPVNDTCVYGTWWDSYPYSSLSVHALHVMYLRVQELSGVTPELTAEIEAARVALDLEKVDYEATVKEKLSFARRAYYQDGERVLGSQEFLKFYEGNKQWLRPYGVFCVLRDLFGTSEHWRWGVFSTFSEDVLNKVDAPGGDLYESTRFWYYLQYNLHVQLYDTAQYARTKGIILKGDLPVGVDKRSVDTWMHPNLFRMNTSTGAPPDAFDANGQNWGFPTYNWENMEQDDYAWWRSRMQHLERYFSAIRIDHILGFFRIWELPASARTGRMGRFRPSLPITRDELLGRGLWDINRLTEPYIQWLEIEATFGDKAQEVAFRYMQECDEQRGLWQFRREFETEQAIFDATAPRQDLPEHFAEEQLNVRAGLMRFFQNRCLIVDPENIDHFYPMFGLEETSSYDALEPWTRDALRDMSHDYYFGRQSSTWRKQARKVLPALLRSNEMLVCGEDLGFTPTCVPPVMAELGILGLRIQRMPPVGESAEFGRPSTYNYLTVCSPSCHDTMTTRAWWEEDAERRERYDEMFGSGVDDSCTPSVMRNIITQHVESPSVLAIFPIQDLLALDAEYSKRPALDETINDPTNPKHYWRFRLHVTCEDMLANSTFIKDVKDVLHERSNIV
jgi:4-alpha-glucanotransferase